MICRRTQPQETRTVQRWIQERHYTTSGPPSCVFVLEFFEGKERIGAIQVGRPTSRELDADLILEITRIVFVDLTERNVESRALSMTRKFVRTWYPSIKLLLSYSDPRQEHDGTIYRADGWAPFGRTSHRSGKGWTSRDGRVSSQSWQKQRWVRTP